jgi:DNA-binding NarL/FixJ family response regulator
VGHTRRTVQRSAAGLSAANELCVGIVASDPSDLRRVAEALAQPEFQVAAVSFDVNELVVETRNLEMDAVVSHCGGSLTGITGSVLRRLRRFWPGVRVVAVCRTASLPELRRALALGLDALVLEDELDAALGPAVRAACAGQLSVPSAARPHVYGPALSHAEREVLSRVAAGLTNNEIAARLHISTSTVKSRLAQAFGKLGVASREEAADALRSVEGGRGTAR